MCVSMKSLSQGDMKVLVAQTTLTYYLVMGYVEIKMSVCVFIWSLTW